MSNRTTSLGAVCALVTLAACADNPTNPTSPLGDAQTPALSAQQQIAAALAGRRSRGAEDEILRLEAAIPGFGGLFVNRDGKVVIFVPQSFDRAELRTILAARASGLHLSQRIRAALATGQQLEVRPSQYSFSNLVEWQARLAPHLRSIKGAIGIDADESINRVRVSITSSDATPAVSHAAAQANIPGDAVVTEVRLAPVSVSGLRGTWRPTGGGVQIANANGDAGRCGLGFNVTTGSGVTGFVTASHCDNSSLGSGNVGNPMYQPIVGQSYLLGTVSINPPFNLSDPNCMGYSLCTDADVMFVAYNDASNGSKRVPYTDYTGFNNSGGSITVTGWWNNLLPPATTPGIGERVDKMGNFTGWTAGTLGSTCDSQIFDSNHVVVCAGRVDGARVGHGDSGSPVFLAPPDGQVNDPLWREGVLFGAAGYFTYDVGYQSTYCYSTCSFWYSEWWLMESRLGTTLAVN